ncbi:putative pumilio homolog 13 [Andrographis paniculata]|uniref:putative pumilio homolog 13 n=1 Tax=Andrographis paniculata TaxID=175694 RepID=UPI0021E79904|nr:putative pumilio homolog 13 [Andrographis paniculata]
MKVDDGMEAVLGEIDQVTSSLDLDQQQHHHFLSNANANAANSSALYHHVDCGYGHTYTIGAAANTIREAQGNNFDGFYESRKHSYGGLAHSPISDYSLPSDGSSSSLFSTAGGSHSDNGSQPLHQFEEFNGWNLNLADDFNLSRDFNKMCINDEQPNASVYQNGVRYFNPFQSVAGAVPESLENFRASSGYMNGSSRGFNPIISREPLRTDGWDRSSGIQNNPAMASLWGQGQGQGQWYSFGQPDRFPRQPDFDRSAVPGYNIHRNNVLASGNLPMGYVMPEAMASFDNNFAGSPSLYASQNRMNLGSSYYSPNMVEMAPMMMPCYNAGDPQKYHAAALNGRNGNGVPIRMTQGRVETLIKEDNFSGSGEGIKHGIPKDGKSKVDKYAHERGFNKNKEKSWRPDVGHMYNADSYKGPRKSFPFILPSKCSSLAEARGSIYQIAKTQNGCRVLQRLFDEGTPRDVQIVLSEIIDHTAELMMNPFGNYLMQKLMEMCVDYQRTRILMKVTEVPGQLMRICLSSHGTRAVQKLIELLTTRQQIAMIIPILKAGFLTLIKDLNGNHVIQRCLECFSYEDKEFIFVAAMKHFVEIGTHQHGCCVLQRCIYHATTEHFENLITEASENALLLAQDAYGNYVVQFILERKNTFATAKLTSRFEGKYVQLSTQKFSSHVVERCLLVANNELRAKIIRELLSTSYFDQLLQDPHANYVIQTALHVSEGRLRITLIQAIESYRAIARNCPYSKRIYSNKHLRRSHS